MIVENVTVDYNPLARIHVKTEDQDSAKKMISIWGKIDSSRFILFDYAIALSNPFFQNPKLRKTLSKGVKANGT